MTFRNRCIRVAAVAACALFTAPLFAQVTATAPAVEGTAENQRFDVYGAAAYSHFNPGFAHQVRATNLIGFEGSGTAWFSNLFGVEATLRGLYGNYDIPNNRYNVPTVNTPMHEYLFLFGPSFRLIQKERYTAGMHVLVGGAYGVFDSGFKGTGVQPKQVGLYNNQLATGYAIGGWGDYKLSPKWAVRFTGDYQPTRYGGIGQNEFFGAVGVVYKWGRRR